MKRSISKNLFIVLSSLALWVLFSLTLGDGYALLRDASGLLVLAIVPGALFLRLFSSASFPAFVSFALAVAFSILLTMTVALIGNAILPFVGVQSPLRPPVLYLEMLMLVLVLSVSLLYSSRRDRSAFLPMLRMEPERMRDFLVAMFPSVFALQAIVGAFHLNNGGDGAIVVALLAEITVFLAYLVIGAKRHSDTAIAIAVSLVALALLLMTSMRGWFITGHDIQREFQVFMLAEKNGIWSMAAYRDAYNACLSITILPAIYGAFLRIPDVYVFKFVFQLFFALVPGVVYELNRKWVRKEYAVLSTIFFFGFPTFYVDMPFLIRQEIAFLFYGLMLYTLFHDPLSGRLRKSLFLLLGAGVVLSHYSTTYTVVLVSFMAMSAFSLLAGALKRRSSRHTDARTAIVSSWVRSNRTRYLTSGMVVAFACMSFFWTTVVTKTSRSVTHVLNETFVAIRDGFTENSRSIDVVNLISFKAPNQQQQLDAYIANAVSIERSASPGAYYDESTYDRYRFVALADERLAPTRISLLLGNATSDTVGFIGQIVAKLMMLLSIIGLCYAYLGRRHIDHLPLELFLLAAASFVFIAMNIILPVLSTEYGIYRALLQSLFLIGFLVVVASATIGDLITMTRKIRRDKSADTRVVFPLLIALAFFVYGTGLLPQIFGGNTPLLHLNNSGRYYDTYLVKAQGTTAVRWVANIAKNEEERTGVASRVEIDHSSVNQFTAINSGVAYTDGIFPGVIRKDSYVYVTSPTFEKKRSTLIYGGDQVLFSYPIEFLDTHKDLLYDNRSVRIYR